MIYVCVDCNQTQEYVFASRRLRGIRNASRAIAAADERIGEQVAPTGGTLIRSLGGIVVAAFDSQPAVDKFLRLATRTYADYGISMESASHTVDQPTDFYRDVLAPLLGKIRARKDRPRVSALAPASAILATTCETSGRGSGQSLVQIGPALSRVSSAEKAKWGMRSPDSEAKYLTQGWADGDSPTTAEGVVAWRSQEPVQDTDMPGTSEARLLGMVFADVNGLGALLPLVAHDEDQLSDFSTGLTRCLRESLQEALKTVFEVPVHMRRSRDPKATAPFQLIFQGGDDLCFAVVGAYALPLVDCFVRCFEQRSIQLMRSLPDNRQPRQPFPSGLTLSAGVVIASYKYPILSFRRLAQGLEIRAKQAGRAWTKVNGSAYLPGLVDFYLVKNSVAGTVQDVRRYLYTPYLVDSLEPAALFGGPYLAGDTSGPHAKQATRRFLPLSELTGAASKLTSFQGLGKLRQLQELLGRDSAHSEYREWWDHLDDAQRKKWNDVCQQLQTPAGRGDLPLRGTPHFNAPVVDCLDLRPLEALRQRWEA